MYQPAQPKTNRTMKYTANKAAKNINSLASQTMVPTLTMLGLPGVYTACRSAAVVATRAIMAGTVAVLTSTPRSVSTNPDVPRSRTTPAGRTSAGCVTGRSPAGDIPADPTARWTTPEEA